MPDKVQTSKLTQTIGVTGLSIWRGVLAEEYLPALKGTRAYKIYQEMADDTVIATLMDSIIMPLLAAEFTVDPASEDSKDADNASFIEDCMMNMRRYTWRQHVLDCLSMMTYGWAMSEITLNKRDDGKLGIDILDPRDQNTLQEWKQGDKGQIEGMIQRDPVSGQLFEIPEWKVVHMTFRPKKRSPEGTSPMRSMYRAWYMRKNMEVMEAIGIERDAAGLPVLKLPYGADAAASAAAQKVIQNLRNDEEAGIVLPPPPSSDPQAQKWDLQLLGGGNKMYNVRETIRDYNKQILMRFFAQFLALGMDSAGTQALVKGSHDFFSLALKSIQQEMLEAWNIQLVPLLIDVNNLKSPNGYPEINWADPGKADLAGISTFLSTLTSVNIITPDNAIEDQIRAMAGLPERDDTVENPRSQANPPVLDKQFAIRGVDGRNQPERGRDRAVSLTNRYQRELLDTIDRFTSEITVEVKTHPHAETLVDGKLMKLLSTLQEIGERNIRAGWELGNKGFQNVYSDMSLNERLDKNRQYLRESYIPDLKAKIMAGIAEMNKPVIENVR